MAHNTTINVGTGGDQIVDYDLATGGAYPTTGKVPAGVLYISANSTTAPTPVTDANGLPVRPATATAWNVLPSSPAAAAYLPVRITDGSAFIGAGTEYAEGDTAATPRGAAVCWVSGTTVHAASTANPLPISDAGGSLTVDGTVGVSGSVAVTGTFWQATQPVSGTVTSNAGTGTMAVSLASLPALATGSNAIGSITNTSFAATQATGTNLHMVVDSGTVTTVSAVTAITNALPAGTNLLGKVGIDQTTAGTTNAVSLAQLGSTSVATGNGVTGAGSLRVTVASDNTAFPVNAVQSGTWNVGTVTTVTGVTNTVNTAPQAATSGGASLPYAFLSTAAVQAANIKATAGQVYGLHFFNLNAAAVYVRLYNLATSPITTDTPVYRAIVPGNTAGAGFVVALPPGIAFGTGIGIRVTGGIADADATALAANTVIGNVFYK